MAEGGKGDGHNKASKDLDKFLQERKTPDQKVKDIVSKSYEKAQMERKHSTDADDRSRQEKEEKLNAFLQKERHRRRRKNKLTVRDVRTEAAKILEEFLQSQLLEQSVQTSAHGAGSRYQRIMEMEISERRTQTGSAESTGFYASNDTLEREESIPFADESDVEYQLRTAGSLPQDDMLITMYANKKPGVEIIHGKSKSVPYKALDESALRHQSNLKPSGMRPPPPPPPGTPFSPSDASGSKESLGYVPYTGFPDRSAQGSSDLSDYREGRGQYGGGYRRETHEHVYPGDPANGNDGSVSSNSNVYNSKHPDTKLPTSPKVPTSLELPTKHSRSGGSTPHSESKSSSPTKPMSESPTKHLGARKKTFIKSGFISSNDSSDEEGPKLKGRKKKTFFKKAQERLHLLLNKQKDHSPEGEDDYGSKETVTKKRPRKRHKKSKKLLDESDSLEPTETRGKCLEERHIHINKHVHQTHPNGDGRVVYRTEDSTEVMDIVSDSESKHIEKHMTVRESADGGKGFIGRIRRMTSREKGKKRMKGSKSSDFHERKGKNHLDVQYGRGLSVPEHRLGHDDDIHITTVERGADTPGHSTVKARQVVDRTNDMRRHSSHLDIVDHDGSLVERVYFDGEEETLPRNQSFDMVEETTVHETEVLENGRVKVIREMTRHDRLVTSEDELETEGAIRHEDGTADTSSMMEEEKEELYGKIAGRLAAIGDNIMLEKGDSFSHHASGQPKSSPDEEMTRSNLTQLEADIRDELRLVADEMDARLTANARQAAMRIAGIVAYDQFSQVVDEQVNKEVGWAQVAAVFNITKRAIQVAGASGSLAIQIKEMSLKYIEDKFASWIVGQGGWDSMLSGSESESDSELD